MTYKKLNPLTQTTLLGLNRYWLLFTTVTMKELNHEVINITTQKTDYYIHDAEVTDKGFNYISVTVI